MSEKSLEYLGGYITSMSGRPNKNDCLVFICPICENGHSIMASFKPPSLFPSGAIWKKTGDNMNNITLKPSINCDVDWTDEKGIKQKSDCKFHGHVRNGMVIY